MPSGEIQIWSDLKNNNPQKGGPHHHVLLLGYIQELHRYKSSGPDNISVNIIQICPELCGPFLHVVKLSFSTLVVPEDMKIATVIAIHKKGEKYLPTNYRPISLLNIFSKVLEKVMSSWVLKSFLNKFKILCDCQFGFRKGHSINLAFMITFKTL